MITPASKSKTPQHPTCGERSGGHQITKGQQAGGAGWYCSLPPDHEGEHAAYDLHIISPVNLIARWHRCGTRLCCRPDHLYVGDDRQNAVDREAHGRTAHPAGESNGNAVITSQQVAEIRAGGDAREHAQRFGISVSHVYRIRRGERWA